MIEKEKETNLITCKEDILNKYPELFTKHDLDSKESFYIENPNPQKLGLFRFMILPAGVVAISSLKKDTAWDIENCQSNGDFLNELNNLVGEKIESGTRDMHHLVQELHYGREEYFLRILPYSDKQSSNVITSILDQRYEDLLNQLPLTMV